MKKWEVTNKYSCKAGSRSARQVSGVKYHDEKIILRILKNREIKTKKQIKEFLTPLDPQKLTAKEVGINNVQLKKSIKRIKQAIEKKESIVVYADYDADGITGGAILWETLYKLGAKVMPYIPHRVEEGYGLSKIGIDKIIKDFNPKLIITVDHGITAHEKVAYAKEKNIEAIVTDHHVKPKKLPKCLIVHTTKLCGAGVAYFLAKELLKKYQVSGIKYHEDELLALAAIGTIADMVPLVEANRSIAKYGLEKLNKTKRIGLLALIKDAGLENQILDTYSVSHILAPRFNAMGRLVHALDALRLICTNNSAKAWELAQKLGITNRERQQITEDTTIDALNFINKNKITQKIIFISSKTYNQGVIGLVAGKIVENYYRPAIVVSEGEIFSKASARSISSFNIIEAIRSCNEFLVDSGGHPMAAGFTVETKKIEFLKNKLEEIADQELDEEKLTKKLKIDLELPIEKVTEDLWYEIQKLSPFGMGNFEPVFVSRNVKVLDAKLIGKDKKHLKLKIKDSRNQIPDSSIDAIGFGMSEFYAKIKPDKLIDIAYSIDMNEWNDQKSLQLKLKDIHLN